MAQNQLARVEKFDRIVSNLTKKKKEKEKKKFKPKSTDLNIRQNREFVPNRDEFTLIETSPPSCVFSQVFSYIAYVHTC